MRPQLSDKKGHVVTKPTLLQCQASATASNWSFNATVLIQPIWKWPTYYIGEPCQFPCMGQHDIGRQGSWLDAHRLKNECLDKGCSQYTKLSLFAESGRGHGGQP